MPAPDSCYTLNRQKLLDAVNRHHWKRELLAEEIGVTPRTLRRWLHGQTSKVQLIHLDILAQKLGCAVRDLITEADDTQDEPALIPDGHPVLRQLRYLVVQGANVENFECATQLVQGCGGELPFDIQAAALYEYARFAFQLGQYQQARRSFERAVMKADAAGMDSLRFQSFLSLAHLSCFSDDDPNGPSLFLEQAEHVLLRIRAAHWRPYLWLMEARHALNRGHLEKALALGQNAMEILGHDQHVHPLDWIEALDMLASIFQAVGSRRKAHEILSTASAAAMNSLSSNHPMRGRLLTRQSSINGFLGERELSTRQAREAVRILDGSLPLESFERTNAWTQLGAALSDQGLYTEGVEAMQQGLEGNPEVEPRLRTNLGLLLNRMGRHAESAEQGRKAVELYTAKYGHEHPDTAAALGRYAGAIQGLGQVETAEKMYADAARLLQAADPFHVRILDQVRNQATCLITMGRHDEAARILETHRRIYSKRDESPLYQGRYSLLQAKAIAGSRQKRDEALQLAWDAKARFQSPGVDPEMRYEAETLISAIGHLH